MNIYNAMNTAKWALLSQQTAIEVTGQNIANVSNPDYNRQVVSLQAQTPVNTGRLIIGSGVTVASVKRQFDASIFNQTLDANFNLNNWSEREKILGRVELVLNEAGKNGINSEISKLFQGFYNLSLKPDGMVERSVIVENAKSLAQKFSTTATDLQTVQSDLNTKITAGTVEINRLTTDIARLNKLVHETETDGATANDYRDQRDAAIKKLSNYADISYFEQSNHEVAVMMRNGRPLVVGQSSFTLSSRTSSVNSAVNEILWSDSAGNQVNITSNFGAGKLGAWVDLRDNEIPSILNQLDKLAGTIVKDVNRLQSSGYGKDGTTGNLLFARLSGGIVGDVSNTGSGVVGTASITNHEELNVDNYRLTFDGAGNYTINNTDTGSASGTYSYTSGGEMSFFRARGLSVSISGTPSAGDIFYVSGAKNASALMKIDSSTGANPIKVASGATNNKGDSLQARRIADLQYKNTIGNEWAVSATASGTYTTNGSFTFDTYLGSLVGSVGSKTNQAIQGRQLSESVAKQVSDLRAQSSGVAIDEEMINLIKYQHAYGAAAKMITTVNTLLQTLLNIV